MFGIGTLAAYDNFSQVGEGTYGYVFKAKDKRTNQTVALKKLVIHKEQVNGFPLFAIREIKYLKNLNRGNIIKLRDIVTSKGAENIGNNILHI